MMDLFTVTLYRSDPSDNFAPFKKLGGQKMNGMSLASEAFRMINILLSRAVLNVDDGMVNDMNGSIYPLNGFYHFLKWMVICNCVLISVRKRQPSVDVRDIIDTCIKHRFGQSLCFKIITITKTCPYDTQRIFSTVKNENLIGKSLIFFLFLLKT